MRDRFVANFQGTRDRPPVAGDLRRIKQQPGETLQKYIQCFNNVRPKIPKVTDEAMMTHKCRGSIVVLSTSKSVKPNEEQKEMISGFQ